jgi:hypothetical protein
MNEHGKRVGVQIVTGAVVWVLICSGLGFEPVFWEGVFHKVCFVCFVFRFRFSF